MVSPAVSTPPKTTEDLFRSHPLRVDETRIIQETVAPWTNDSVLGTAIEKNGRFQPFGAVTRREIFEWLPQVWEWQLRINLAPTMYWIPQPLLPACIVRENYVLPSNENNFKPAYFDGSDNMVSGFNCVLLDLDVGRENSEFTGSQALEMIDRADAEGWIPTPSLVALSGRGAYVFWFLRDENGAVIPFSEANHTRWRAILAALANVAEALHLEPDPRAKNRARYVKLPGTFTARGDKVRYWMRLDETGRPPRYTFNQIEKEIGMPSPHADLNGDAPPAPALAPVSDPTAPPKPPRKVQYDKNGKPYGSYRAAAYRREIWHLATNRRGGISEGYRHWTLLHYFRASIAYHACFYPGCHVEALRYARAETFNLNALFSKPMPDAEVEKAMRKPKKPSTGCYARGATVARDLGVTAPEAEQLALKTIVPEDYRAELTQRRVDSSRTRQEFFAKQREDIRETLKKHPTWAQTPTRVANQLGIRNPKDGSPYRQLVNMVVVEMRQAGELPKPKREDPAEQPALPGIG